MRSKKLSLVELVDLIKLEAYRKIIDPQAFLETIVNKGMPKVIRDVRGAVFLAVEREGEDFLVTRYPTKQSNQSISEVY